MTDRELRATIRQRFTALRAEVQQRRTELITDTEAQLFERYRVENERADELDRGLKESPTRRTGKPWPAPKV